jgi:excisionase family DNA binding protein
MTPPTGYIKTADGSTGPHLHIDPGSGDNNLITTAEAAEILRVSTVTVARMARQGKIPHRYKLPGGRGVYVLDVQQVLE